MEVGQYRQHVPRPSNFRLGDLPTWASRGDLLGSSLGVEAVRRALEAIPDNAMTDSTAALSVKSAVLVPLIFDDYAAKVVLIRRASSLALDPGHVALPGGRVERDETPLAAALREAEEEIGLSSSEVEFLAPLRIVERASDGQVVAPFVGLLRQRPEFVVNESEVDAIFEVPLSGLMVKGVGWQELWDRYGTVRPIRFFADPELLGDDVIWGLTARILWDLLELITAVG